MSSATPNQAPTSSGVRADLAILLFLTLFGTYAYFWQSRDWNAASRLMLTYSLVDRHQVYIDGLEGQAGYGRYNPVAGGFEMLGGDLARVGDHYFTDKAPGQSFLGALVYFAGRLSGKLAEHPRDEAQARAYWPADYFVTLGTSGLLTALLGVVIYAFSLRLGATHGSGVLLALAYGLGTPALVYATLFYGHQTSAFCTLASFFLLYRARHEGRNDFWSMSFSGLLAGYSVVVEYQTAVISAVLGVYALLAIRSFRPVATFALAAVLATSILAAYNYAAFGDPLDLGYAHEVSREFKAIHSSKNPLGIRLPGWEKASEILPGILWKPFRGLVYYAPVLCLAPLGLCALLWRRHWGVALVALAAVGWMLALNLAYPLWEGGWCTGPRLMVPALPFAILIVAGLVGAARHAVVSAIVGVAACGGALLMIACVAVGGRFPPDAIDPESGDPFRIKNPVTKIVIPHWSGVARANNAVKHESPHPEADPICPLCRCHPSSYLAGGHQFERNAGRWLMARFSPPGLIPAEPSPWRGLQMAPLLAYLLVMVTLFLVVQASRLRLPFTTVRSI
jgi:hypothetical protein